MKISEAESKVLEVFWRSEGPLSAEEWTLMRRHPEIGEKICRPLQASRAFAPIIRHHHEFFDGSGYPRGLVGAEIPIQTRMMTIADIFDALTAADRPYKKAVPVARALDVLNDDVRQGRLDPDLFALFVEAGIHKAGGRVTSFPLLADS